MALHWIRTNKQTNSAGFSLVELMVAVGIVGIIAAVAIPQYSKFSARGRQSAAKAELTTMYAAERNFRAEAPSYTGCLRDIGVDPTGNGQQRSNYSYGYLDTVAQNACGRTGAQSCYGTKWNAAGVGVAGIIAGYDCPAPGRTGFAANSGVTGGATTVAQAHTPTGWTVTDLVTKDWFVIRAAGNITTGVLTGNTPYDMWNINSNKQLQNSRSGV